MIDNLSTRFSVNKEKVFTLQNLIPSHGAKMKLNELIDMMEPMKSLLPFSSAEFEAELKIWEHIWAENSDKDLMPALFQMLKIFATLPITTATSERSFSTLKRVETYLRNTMGEERLSGNALISIHGRSIDMDPNEIINEMAKSKRNMDIIL